MSANGNIPENRDYAAIRIGISMAGIVVLLLIAFLWSKSYFTGMKWYRSTWQGPEADATERAGWLFSNYGSFGIAWRRQAGDLGNRLPENAREVSNFPASRTALSHVHPEGAWSWHWIHRVSTTSSIFGSVKSDYGHLFVPYWMPFLVVLFVVVSVNAQGERKRRSNQPPKMD